MGRLLIKQKSQGISSDINQKGSISTEIICFFLLEIAALLLNDGLSSQALPPFWVVLPLLIKISLEAIQRRATENS